MKLKKKMYKNEGFKKRNRKCCEREREKRKEEEKEEEEEAHEEKEKKGLTSVV